MARAVVLGFLVGFPIAASPGPIFFLVLRRTLARGWPSGLSSGLGVATGDATYAALAAFGVAAVTGVLIAERRWIGLVGGIAIALIGLRTLKVPHPDPPPKREGNKSGLAGASGSMVALTLGNPPTILSFTAVFAGLGTHVAAGWITALALVIGVLLGSLSWWVVLTGVASRLRERLTPAVIRGIGIVSGVALLGFGVVTVGAALTG
ncbi:MAG TPA: LysE family transporter [Candidatus Dormibacteraeota bacterium]|nr:LysE family transporter [Candidatus Dormibacteraeota bacterium]